jgi:Transposase DDE domain
MNAIPPTPMTCLQKPVRKHLHFDALIALLRDRFQQIADPRPEAAGITLSDALLSGFALFSLKDPSLLAFDERRDDSNLHTIYRIETVPSDTHLRTLLDDVDPECLRPGFTDIFRQLQRGKALEPFVFFEGCYLMALDGTTYFSSQAIHCPSCLEKKSKAGTITYSHQLLGAALIHPDFREVIPLMPEPIIKQDGDTKNDCERNAAKRLLHKIRQDHPHLSLIVVEDGLASNAPHIRLLKDLKMHFLLGVQPGDHEFLFDRIIAALDDDRVSTRSWQEGDVHYEISFVHDVPLNEANQDLRVNFLHYAEYGPDGECRKCFTWVTDLRITRGNAPQLVRGGRARWKIENETFNTLKNQGYHYEHNFGHGEKHLSVVLALLMMLAFLVDQVQQLCCPLFRAVWAKLGSKRALWDNLRSHFRHFVFRSMRQLYEAILYDLAKELPPSVLNSS